MPALARLVSREGVEHPELAEDILDLTLSLSEEAVVLRSSSSRVEPSPSPPMGALELELPDTVLAMESFFLWWPSGVIRRRKRDSLEALPEAGVGLRGSTWQESSNDSRSSMMRTDSNHLEKPGSRSIE